MNRIEAEWTVKPSGAYGKISYAEAAGGVVVVAFERGIMAFQQDDGRELWRWAPAGSSGVDAVKVTAGAVVVFSAAAGGSSVTATGYELRSGEQFLRRVYSSQPELIDNLLVGSSCRQGQCKVEAVNLSTRRQQWFGRYRDVVEISAGVDGVAASMSRARWMFLRPARGDLVAVRTRQSGARVRTVFIQRDHGQACE